MVCSSFSDENYSNKIQTRQNVEKMLNVAILLMKREETNDHFFFVSKLQINCFLYTSKITPTPHSFTLNNLSLP